MGAVKFAVAALIVVVAYLGWQKHREHAQAAALAAITDERGFIEFAPPKGGDVKEVLIVAAQNCPHEGAVRADQMASEMKERQVRFRRSSSVNFEVPAGADDKTIETFMDRHNDIMNREVPLVFVNGRVKSNPDVDEVLAEYELANR